MTKKVVKTEITERTAEVLKERRIKEDIKDERRVTRESKDERRRDGEAAQRNQASRQIVNVPELQCIVLA